MSHTSQDVHKKVLGRKSEKLVEEYLKKQGIKILKRNYRTPFGEADIVAKDGDTIVIVEVKTRRSTYLVEPETAVDVFKQRNLIWAANSFVNRFQYDNDIRFDIISIVIDRNNEKRIEHIEDAFYPSLR